MSNHISRDSGQASPRSQCLLQFLSAPAFPCLSIPGLLLLPVSRDDLPACPPAFTPHPAHTCLLLLSLLFIFSLSSYNESHGRAGLVLNCLGFIVLGIWEVSINTLELVRMWRLKGGHLSSWGHVGSTQSSSYHSPPWA